MNNYSPLRYPGGKSKLYQYLSFIIKHNAPINNYIEPYAGGAGAALALLMNQQVKEIILNDSDELIYKFWLAVLNRNRHVQARLLSSQISVEAYKAHKELIRKFKMGKKVSDFGLGFSTLYINRCNRSGILKSGPIGGYNQEGTWKIDARFNKEDLVKRLEHIYDFRKHIKVFNYDALDFLRKLSDFNINPEESLVYLDPPYYVQGRELYRKYYKPKDHLALKEYLKNDLHIRWVLSYDDIEEIHKLYSDVRKNGIVVNHFANKAKVGKELLIFSDNCNVPM